MMHHVSRARERRDPKASQKRKTHINSYDVRHRSKGGKASPNLPKKRRSSDLVMLSMRVSEGK